MVVVVVVVVVVSKYKSHLYFDTITTTTTTTTDTTVRWSFAIGIRPYTFLERGPRLASPSTPARPREGAGALAQGLDSTTVLATGTRPYTFLEEASPRLGRGRAACAYGEDVQAKDLASRGAYGASPTGRRRLHALLKALKRCVFLLCSTIGICICIGPILFWEGNRWPGLSLAKRRGASQRSPHATSDEASPAEVAFRATVPGASPTARTSRRGTSPAEAP